MPNFCPDAKAGDRKAVFRKLMFVYHPDKKNNSDA